MINKKGPKKGLRRSKSMDLNDNTYPELKKSSQSATRNLRLGLLEAYIPVAVVDFLRKNDDLEVPAVEREKETAVMFVDVSNFTKLTEEMTSYGPGGLEKHVDNLNDLFDVILERVRHAGGDVLKFAGDAIEIYWPRLEGDLVTLEETVRRAVQCALDIQGEVKNRFAEVDFSPYSDPSKSILKPLRVKLGIGVGQLSMVHLGGNGDRLKRKSVEFTPVGPGIIDSHSCERVAEPGQVIVTERVMEVINSDFQLTLVKNKADKPHFVVLGNHDVRRTTVHRKQQRTSKALTVVEYDTLKLSSKPDAERLLWAYLPNTILAYLDRKGEFWLPEFRRVTTIFFNIGMQLSIERLEEEVGLLQTLQKVFSIIQSTVFRYEGTINKMFFDKGNWNVIVVFGLSPFAHDDDAKRGLLCALAVLGSLNKSAVTRDLTKCSAGVTTGLAFCGVLGSTESNMSVALGRSSRGKKLSKESELSTKSKVLEDNLAINRQQKEYTVIGDCINLASRLMDVAFKEEQVLFYDEQTRLATQDTIPYVPKGPRAVKGKEQGVAVFQVAALEDSFQSIQQNKMNRMSVRRGAVNKTASGGRMSRSGLFTMGKTLTRKGSRKKSSRKSKYGLTLPGIFMPKESLDELAKESIIYENQHKEPAEQNKLQRMRNQAKKIPKKSVKMSEMNSFEQQMIQTIVQSKGKPDRRHTQLLPLETIAQFEDETSLKNVLGNLDNYLSRFHEKCTAMGSLNNENIESLFARRKLSSFAMVENVKKPKGKLSLLRRKSSVLSRTRRSSELLSEDKMVVMLEGGIGSGKTHALAQVFLSRKCHENNTVLIAAGNPFEADAESASFAVWKIFINALVSQILKSKLNQDVKMFKTKEDVLKVALEHGREIFFKSPIPEKSTEVNKLEHQVNKEDLHVLNPIIDTRFEVREQDAQPKLGLLEGSAESFERLVVRDASRNQNEKNISVVISVLSAVISGLAVLEKTCNEKGTVLVIDDAHYMNALSWLVCVEIGKWFNTACVLLVLGLRNNLFKQELAVKQGNIRKLSEDIYELINVENGEVDRVEANDFKKFSAYTKAAKQSYLDIQSGPSSLVRKLLSELKSTALVRLKPQDVFVPHIITHHRTLSSQAVVPPELIKFLTKKTRGNPLYIVDAISQYEADKLLAIEMDKITLNDEFHTRLNNGTLKIPQSVESVCGMVLDSLSTTQQIALKIAAMVGESFSKKMVKSVFPIKDKKAELEEEWEALVSADVIELVETYTGEINDEEEIMYRFHAEWVKESLVNRMMFKQKSALTKQINSMQKRNKNV